MRRYKQILFPIAVGIFAFLSCLIMDKMVPIVLEWKNLFAVGGLILSLYASTAILLTICFSGLRLSKKQYVWMGVLIALIVPALIFISLRINDKYYKGFVIDWMLHSSFVLIGAVDVIAIIIGSVGLYAKTRGKSRAIKVLASIIFIVFCASLGSPQAFYNYIHKDAYKDLKNIKITKVSGLDYEGTDFDFVVDYGEDEMDCKLQYCGASGWRLLSEYEGELSDYGAGQLLSYYLDEENPCEAQAISTYNEGEKYVLTASDGSCVEISCEPFNLTFKAPSGNVSAEINTIGISGGNTVIRGSLLKEEAMWGGGEHFDHINQRGQHVEINAIDMYAKTEGNSYMPIPILISSRGSGLFMNRYERMTIDVDSYEVPNDVWQFVTPSQCDLFIYTTENPKDVLYGYSTITGFAPEPSDWNYGTIVCRYYPDFASVEGVMEMARAMEENNLTWDAVIIEGFASENTGLIDGKEYNEQLDTLKEMCEAVHALGKKVLIYSATGKVYYQEYDEEKIRYVLRADNGSKNIPEAYINNPVDHPGVGTSQYVDITDEEVSDYWFNQVWGAIVNDLGVDGSKIDFCEQFPDFIELDFADGETSGAHHWYPTVFNAKLYKVLSQNENGTLAFARGGGIGAQRYPFVWMGDQRREMQYLRSTLKGVLSSGISGVPFTSYDMAGYNVGYKESEEVVFTRAIEYTAFTGIIQTHGNVKRPYDFDEEIIDIYRKYSSIHDALRPYLVEQGKISSTTGLPLVRHLAIDYWTDKNVWDIEDEFMLGEGLLVAPILYDAEERDIYLPEGEWINIWTGETIGGGKWLKDYKVPFEEIAVFKKASHESATLEDVLVEVAKIHG